MAGYHKYVFDTEKRRFVGNFEEMYKSEDTEGFDSWHERDLRPLRKKIPLAIINQYNFDNILEIGCGKGTFTQFLKKQNNHVVALDISGTAIEKARRSYPDIEFKIFDVEKSGIETIVSESFTKLDLILVMGSFAYIETWPKLIEKAGRLASYFLVCEYIPNNPIGFVKSTASLINEFSKHFSILAKVVLDDEHIFLFGKTLTTG